jgi:multidrug efflux system outer membrane protein
MLARYLHSLYLNPVAASMNQTTFQILHPHLHRTMCCGILIGSLLAAGCSSLMATPEHERPAVSPKQHWSIELADERTIDKKWWQAFHDPQLDHLMEQAIGENLNLQILAARTELAKAQIGQAKASLLPIVNFGARTDTTDISGSTDLGTTNKVGTGGDLLWELDVWGKARKGVAAQKAAYKASEAEWRAGYLTMASSVAAAYFQLRRGDEQQARQRQAIARGTEILDIYERMLAQGIIAKTQVLQQQAELNQLTAALYDLERVRALSENALATLIGKAAGNYIIADTHSSTQLVAITVPAGLPSEILSRRPDIVAAEYRLMQAVALEGQARLARLPTVGLTGIGGSASYSLGDLLKTWTAGLSSVVQFPVFNPAIRARIPVSEAQTKVAEAQYRASVMQAFEEVENLLITIESRHRQQAEYTERRERMRSVRQQQQAQLRLGLISQLQLLEQERSLLAAEQAVLNNYWQLLEDTVALFKAVGGGWDREDFASH